MDDSERSYGYSRDIYHGKNGAPDGEGLASEKFEESYEYAPERGIEADASDLSPEEAALHIVRQGGEEPSEEGAARQGGATYDYDRAGDSGEVDSFTWDLETEDRKGEAPPKPS